MADSNKNFVTNNETFESDNVIKLTNPFKTHQQNQIEDFSLFFSASKKCRCCFNKLINESDQQTVESWHRQAFFALTGVEMMTPDSENFLCMKCAEILKIFTELGKSAADLQRKYNILMQGIKTERNENNEVSEDRQEDHNLQSNIVKSDYEIVSYDNDQSKHKNSSDTIMQNEIMNEDIENITETRDSKVIKCTVRLTRIDPETVDNYEYYPIAGCIEKQTIASISSKSIELEKTSRNDRVHETSLKVISKAQSNTNCHICGFSSKSLRGLKRHITDRHITPNPYCDLCGKTFSRKGNIRGHMQLYHMNIKSSCNFCSAEFESSAKLLDHKLIAHRKNFKCEECDAAFGRSGPLSEHIKAMHDGKRWYCHYQDCSSSFSIKKFAIKHLKKFHSLHGQGAINKYLKAGNKDQSKPKCQICGLIEKNQEDLYEHLRTTHDETMRLSCDLCGKTFSHLQKMDLIEHMHTHQLIQLKVKFSCSLCPAEFHSNFRLFSHEKIAHNKKFQCEICDVSFIEVRHLKEHVKVQHEGKRYNCPVPGCSRSYLLIGSARMHLYRTHSLKGEEYRKYSAKLNPIVESKKEVVVKCQICRKITKSRRALLSHVRYVHNKNKSCDICGICFAHKSLLIDHMHTYHMNLKFKCDLCQLEFRSEFKRNQHKKVTHNKKFKCDKCDLTFSGPQLLKEHVKVKHEGKRYYCSYPGCSISFTTKGYVAKHLFVAHSLVGENFNKFKEKLKLQ